MFRSYGVSFCIISLLVGQSNAQDNDPPAHGDFVSTALQEQQPEGTLPPVVVSPPAGGGDGQDQTDEGLFPPVEFPPQDFSPADVEFSLPGDLFRAGPVDGYRAETAAAASRVQTPIMETPFSVQVVPEQVLRDQQTLRVYEAVDNTSGVFRGDGFGDTVDDFWIRGFRAADGIRRDGARIGSSVPVNLIDPQNIERIEILKGPASIFYGQVEPGGIVNIVTKRPNGEHFTDVRQILGSFDLTRTTLDTSGRLDGYDGRLLYRVNAAYENWDTFRDYPAGLGTERTFLAPVLTWLIGEETSLTFEFNYTHQQRPVDRGIVLFNDGSIPDIPFSRFMGDVIDDSKTNEYVYGTEFFSPLQRLVFCASQVPGHLQLFG